jgi:hypothetical protein
MRLADAGAARSLLRCVALLRAQTRHTLSTLATVRLSHGDNSLGHTSPVFVFNRNPARLSSTNSSSKLPPFEKGSQIEQAHSPRTEKNRGTRQ